MTIEEALEHLKLHEYWADFSWMDEVAELAISALEKQIPKKPMLKDHDHDEYFSMSVECGECGALLGSWDYGRAYCNGSKEWFIENHRFCNRCGQAIDWSGKE